METFTKQKTFAWLALICGIALIAYQVLLVDFGFFDERVFWVFSLISVALMVFAGVLFLYYRTGTVSTVGLVICALSLAFLITQFITALIRDFNRGGHRP
ncbi:hypothetical protein [Edaphobacter modestus]|uniref:Uncharacterized protein n=1 Tax=Edaphobacter modestus TaxID=388466 RepID=A0A4Q7YUA4_9BACT|nr:hypothetical protein [Edaphobacter modestus]RZU40874.1 hypothetical protein BDD14_2360 [Edaphobacter modestus]